MRSKKAIYNILGSFSFQLISIISGLIIPRLIISTFGSDVNGLVVSITQFLGYIVIIESGIGGVVRAALYKPLADLNTLSISKVVRATEKFFRIIGIVFVGYLFMVSLVFPYLITDFSSMYTFSLILIIGISTFFQYFFGIAYQILLQADQKLYVIHFIQILTLIINTTIIVIMIKLGVGIHLIKLGSSIVFLARPIIINFYVKKKYNLIKGVQTDSNTIKQKWDGLGHHIAFLIHNTIDIALITIFLGVKEVSVYSVYYMISSSVKRINTTFSAGLEAAFGNMIAKNERTLLEKNFSMFESLSYIITTILFTSALILINSFIVIYTKGIEDANYYRPLFAYIIILSEAVYCLRLPYQTLVLAAGHYKETKLGAFVEAGINLVLSVVLIRNLGIVGVAIATLLAMLFRTTQYAIYLSKNILKRNLRIFLMKMIIYCSSSAIMYIFINLIFKFSNLNSYYEWFIRAILVTVIISLLTIGISSVFYREDVKVIKSLIKGILKKRMVK